MLALKFAGYQFADEVVLDFLFVAVLVMMKPLLSFGWSSASFIRDYRKRNFYLNRTDSLG